MKTAGNPQKPEDFNDKIYRLKQLKEDPPIEYEVDFSHIDEEENTQDNPDLLEAGRSAIAQKTHEVTGLAPEDERTLEIAELYREFPQIKDAYGTFKKVLESKERNPDFARDMTETLETLRKATEILELSLKNQEEYGLVDKRWMRDTASLRDALTKGRLAMELDIRLDRESEFWVSHAVGAKATVFPPFIHKMTSEEMAKNSRRYHLAEGLAEFAKYGDRGHRLILELKTLGDDPEKFPQVLKRLQALLKRQGIEESVAVASLSPGILMATHEVMPKMPLILNGGIVPGISYTEKGEKLIKGIVPADKKWRAIGVKPFGEVVVSAGENSPRRPDGQGIQTGYALTKLPSDLVEVFRAQRQEGQKFGGLVSLSTVTILASALDLIGATQRASELRKYYTDIVNELGLGKMATTWGQALGKIPGFRHLAPQEQLKVFKRELGLDTIIYTKSPEKWAEHLPGEMNDLLH